MFEFPLYIPLPFIKIHPYFLFEGLAYFIGFRLYLRLRRKGWIPVENRATENTIATHNCFIRRALQSRGNRVFERVSRIVF